MGAEFFDADGDGDLDLYVGSGSNEWADGASEYRDRLYMNTGNGRFQASQDNALPVVNTSTSCIESADFDGDGDLDLFVGGRLNPGRYPMAGKSTLLLNNDGQFTDNTSALAPGLSDIGMVTDAKWIDIDGDNDLDLIVIGEWMAPTIFTNNGGQFANTTVEAGLSDYLGWWYTLEAADIDNDGDLDFVAGNLGLNSKYEASVKEPFRVYSGDLDGDGSNDIVLAYYDQGISYPVRGRQCSSEQIPELKQKFPTYEAFSTASVEQVYAGELGTALRLEAKHFATSYIENLGDGKFAVHALPSATQRSTVNGVVIVDVNQDGNLDIVTAGNMYNTEVETSRHDGAVGAVLLGDGAGGFNPEPLASSGFVADGNVKDLSVIKGISNTFISVTRNNAKMSLYRITTPPH